MKISVYMFLVLGSWLLGEALLASSAQAQIKEAGQEADAYTSPSDQQLGVELLPLKHALVEVEQRHDVKIMYSSDIVSDRDVPVKQAEHLLKVPRNQLVRELSRTVHAFGLQLRELEGDNFVLRRKKEPAPLARERIERPIQLTRSIEGTVTDQLDNVPLPGVNIVAKGTSVGTVTDVEGNYRITLSDTVQILVFSSVGYLSEEVTLGNQTTLNVALSPDVQSLQEVVVTGYGTQAREDVTSSIASVRGEELTKLPVPRLDQALQGQVPGLVVTTNDGTPGGDVSLRIRGYGTAAPNGDNAPLYVIDGVPSKQGINLLNPNDIATIDVLKDAAAASIYGVQASNGVIVITTKRGKAGKTRLTLDTYHGISTAWRKDIPVMNPRQLAELNNVKFAEDNQGLTPEDDAYNAPNPAYAEPATIPTEGTDWQKAIFRNGRVQDYNLGITGGSEETQYALSAGYRSQEGIIINSDMKRYTFRASVDHAATDFLKAGANFSYSQVERNGIVTNVGFDAVTSLALSYPSIFPVREEDGSYGLLPEVNAFRWGGAKNPVALAERADRTNTSNGINGAIYGDFKITDGLSFRSLFGLGRWFGENRIFNLPTLWTADNESFPASLSLTSFETLNWNWDNTLTYTKAFRKQSFSVVVGVSQQVFQNGFVQTRQDGFQAKDPAFRYFGFGDPGTVAANGSQEERTLLSYFGRLNYEYDNRYLAQLVVRHDGSSVFAEGQRWGTFPAASLGWRVSEEGFMQGVSWIDDLKIRASWGQTGNQFIGDFYPTYSRLGSGVTYVLGGQVFGGVRPSQLGNPLVSWETAQQWDVGFDLALGGDRLSISGDFYRKATADMLLKVTLPAVGGGADPPAQNVGTLVNQGVELAITYRSRPDRAFTYTIAANGATLNNEITNLGDLTFVLPNNRITYGLDDEVTRALVGSTVSSYYGYVSDGIYQNQEEIDAGPTPDRNNVQSGDVRWKDISGPDGVPDGAITEDDRTLLGDAIPDLTYGLNLTANYQNFDLSALWQGVLGVDVFSVVYRATVDEAGGRNGLVEALRYWNGEGSTNVYPRAAFNDPAGNRRVSDRYVMSGDYVRLRNLQVGYSLPEAVRERFGMQQCRFYVGVQNLLTFTPYFGFDPEVGQNANQGGSNQDLQLGIDQGVYPLPRTFTLGASVTF